MAADAEAEEMHMSDDGDGSDFGPDDEDDAEIIPLRSVRSVRPVKGGKGKASGGGKAKPAGGGGKAAPKPKPAAAWLTDHVLKQYILFKNMDGMACATPKQGVRVARLLDLKGQGSLQNELAREYFKKRGSTPSTNAMAEAMRALSGFADEGKQVPTPLRVYDDMDEPAVWVNLADEDKRVIKVTSRGWGPIDFTDGAFLAAPALHPIRTVKPGHGAFGPLRRLMNVSDEAWDFIIAWWITTFITDIPHVVPIITGEQGTAKTWATRILVRLVDPSAGQEDGPPRDSRDFYAAAKMSWAYMLENVSRIEPWFNDALCRLVTGAGHRERELYKNSDGHVIELRRVIAINGIDIIGIGGDLAERSIGLRLEPIRDEARRTEEELDRELAKALPSAYGALLDLLVEVLGVARSGKHKIPTLPRMADFAQWVHYVDIARGSHALKFYLAEKDDAVGEVSEDHVVTGSLREFIMGQKGHRWLGQTADLYARLVPPIEADKYTWPKTATQLSGVLTRLAPGLRTRGWVLKRRKSNGRVLWEIARPRAAERAKGSFEGGSEG